jgi:hypothetical protein
MNMKITSLMTVLLLVLVISVGIAQAEEQLSAAQMDIVTAGANRLNGANGSNRTNNIENNRNEYFTLAFADAFADCSGSVRCITDAVSIALVTGNTATSASSSFASTHWQ